MLRSKRGVDWTCVAAKHALRDENDVEEMSDCAQKLTLPAGGKTKMCAFAQGNHGRLPVPLL